MTEMDDILAKYFSGETTAEENAIVMTWKTKHEEEFAQLSQAWTAADLLPSSIKEFKTFDSAVAWTKVDNKLIDYKEVKVVKMHFYRKVAAACAILLVGLAGLWFINRGPKFEQVENTAKVPQEINLPDGSKVWLAADATLNYHPEFAVNRSLTLDGEAFFEVERDELHPFIIETKMGNIEVLGTAFNVKSSDIQTVVSVDHGKVALSHNTEKIELTKGESATANKDGLTSKTDIDKNYQSWKTGKFYFKQTPLSEVIELLNAHYPQKIELLETRKEPIISGTFENRPIEEIIDMIVLTCQLEAEYGEDVIRLK